MHNPVTYALNISGTKPIDLARELGLSRQYISRAELGCFVNLNDKLLKWVQNVVNRNGEAYVTHDKILNAYDIFKRSKRINNLHRLGWEIVTHDMPPVARMEKTPDRYRTEFITWRQHHWGTSYRFAKDFCFHPGSIDDYESGKVNKIPNDLMAVLVWIERNNVG
jgi:transcriptional regulator with XRE-family HTH domain